MIRIVDIQQLYLDYWFLAQLLYLTSVQGTSKRICPLLDLVCTDIWEQILDAFITPSTGYEGYITWQVMTGHTHGFINAAPTEKDIWN
jgi:hypothetical protein